MITESAALRIERRWGEGRDTIPLPRVPANPPGCFAPGIVVATTIQDSPGERDQVTGLLGLLFQL